MDTSTRRLLVPLSLALALALSCATQPQPEGGDGKGYAIVVNPQAVPDTYPALGFDPRPDYIDDDTLILTFDDGPDWNNTGKVLDVLKDKGVKASFFINTKNWSDVDADQPMQALVRRMVDEGHELASHSVTHPHLPTLGAAGIDAELSGVENTVKNVVGPNTRLTLFRAPFGEPYQDGNGYELVAPVVAEHAIHIGWNLDVFDYNCPAGDAQCVLNNFKNGVKTPGQGSWGIVLLHSVHAQTADSIGDMIDYARDNGFKFGLVEDVVCTRFGKSSARVVDGTSGGCADGPQPGDPDAGPGDPDDPDAGPGDPDDPDAGPGDPDDPDAGDDPGGDDDPGTGGMNGTCGCRAGGATGGAGGLGFLLLAPLALLALRRRRR